MPLASYLTYHSMATPYTYSNTYPPSKQRKDTNFEKKGSYKTSCSFPIGNPVVAYFEEPSGSRTNLQ